MVRSGDKNPMWGKTHSPEVILRAKIARETRKAEWGFLPNPKVYVQHLRGIYQQVKNEGKTCAPRGQKIIEIENFGVTLPPYLRFANFQSRKFSLGYVKREFLWYLRGNLADLSIGEHAKLWNSLVVDGKLNSNYGYYMFKRGGVDWVVDELTRDRDSRRAVFTILDHTHAKVETKDFPCTYGMGFRIRDNRLNATVRMRSCDAIWGFCNDLPAFSLVQEMVLKYLQRVYPGLEMGTYHHSADSFHVYERHFSLLDALAARTPDKFSVILCPQMSSADEVDFLRTGDFSTIPESFKFAKWLWDTQNLDVLGNYTFTNIFFV
jgi:thymidylate synthase